MKITTLDRYQGSLLGLAIRDAMGVPLIALSHFFPVERYWNLHPLASEIVTIADGSFLEKKPPEIRGKGYDVDSLEAALWAFDRTDTFRDGCLAVVNLGDDSDTTEAIYGQLAGAYYGSGAIPDELKNTELKTGINREVFD